MRIARLKVDGRECPLGNDSLAPRFGWSFADTGRRAAVQTAYRIRVFANEADAERELWDSGIRQGRRHTGIRYGGSALASAQRYYWQVTVWDEQGSGLASEISWWETGLLAPQDWKGRWIGAPDRLAEGSGALPLLRKTFEVSKPLRQARAYVSGLGHFELRLNGDKTGERELEPGWTNYDQTCFYSVYDVTDRLAPGSNVVGVMLGNGFYHVEGGRYTKFTRSFGKPKCLAQLELRYADGTTEYVVSDESWRASEGPIVFSCMYGGEDYDARKEQTGWDSPAFAEDERWLPAAYAEPPKGGLRVQPIQPLKVMQRFAPCRIERKSAGVWLVDFGQNFSGWTELAVTGPAGAEIRIWPAERLTDDEPDQRMTGSPYVLTYTLKGEGVERWRPRFTYYGFRYAQVEATEPISFQVGDGGSEEAASSPLALLELQGQMLYPDFATTGSFACSNALFNRIHAIIGWAILSNAKSIFTDCPHREKLGWLEQVYLMAPSIIYNWDVESLLLKVLEDIRDAQQPDGMIPTTAPEYVVFEPPWAIFRDSASWGAAYTLTSWELLKRYGNDSSIARHYGGMKAYVDYLSAKTERDILVHGLGDWYDVGDDGPGFAQNTPVPLVETAIFYHLLVIMAEMADMLGEGTDAVRYREQSVKVRQAFNDTFFDRAAGCYAGGSQTANAMPLALGLVEETNRAAVLDRLVRDIENRGFHTSAGDIGHRYVLKALADESRSELIYHMTCKTEHPSYGFQVEHGATTLTEAWDGPTVGKSQNHFMLGHIEEWFYQSLAGISVQLNRDKYAFEVTIKPVIAGELSCVDGCCDTPAGRVEVSWQRAGRHRLRLKVVIPVNTDAIIHVPAISAEAVKETGGGSAEWLTPPKLVRHENGYCLYEAGSGVYIFDSELDG